MTLTLVCFIAAKDIKFMTDLHHIAVVETPDASLPPASMEAAKSTKSAFSSSRRLNCLGVVTAIGMVLYIYLFVAGSSVLVAQPYYLDSFRCSDLSGGNATLVNCPVLFCDLDLQHHSCSSKFPMMVGAYLFPTMMGIANMVAFIMVLLYEFGPLSDGDVMESYARLQRSCMIALVFNFPVVEAFLVLVVSSPDTIPTILTLVGWLMFVSSVPALISVILISGIYKVQI